MNSKDQEAPTIFQIMESNYNFLGTATKKENRHNIYAASRYIREVLHNTDGKPDNAPHMKGNRRELVNCKSSFIACSPNDTMLEFLFACLIEWEVSVVVNFLSLTETLRRLHDKFHDPFEDLGGRIIIVYSGYNDFVPFKSDAPMAISHLLNTAILAGRKAWYYHRGSLTHPEDQYYPIYQWAMNSEIPCYSLNIPKESYRSYLERLRLTVKSVKKQPERKPPAEIPPPVPVKPQKPTKQDPPPIIREVNRYTEEAGDPEVRYYIEEADDQDNEASTRRKKKKGGSHNEQIRRKREEMGR